MILGNETTDIKRHGIVDKSEFGIISSPKMFKLLSSNLYKYKVAAVVRELSTNAYDSHVMAGKADVPFSVHLPTSSEPFFSIRDFGVGITPEQADKIYRFYGASDKSNSNDYTGCMGLGSKSPFCYTSSFTVTSIVDGKKWIYTCTFSDRPELNLMIGPVDTNEANGVEVSVPVNSSDFSTFTNAAVDIYKWFKVKPTFNKYMVFPLADEGVLFKNDNSHITCNSYSCAIMGNVAYPITTNVFSAHIISLLHAGVALYFNIGDIEFDIGREGLQYTPKTIGAITAQLEKLKEDFQAYITTELDKNDCAWDAYLSSVSLKNQFRSRLNDLIGQCKTKFGKLEHQQNISLGNDDKSKCSKIITKFFKRHYRLKKTIVSSFQNTATIDVENAVLFAINDTTSNHLVQHCCKCAINSSHAQTVYLTSDFTEDELIQALKINKAKIVYISELKNKYKIVRAKREKKLQFEGYFKTENGATATITDTDKKYYYVQTHRDSIIIDDVDGVARTFTQKEFRELVKSFRFITGDKVTFLYCATTGIKNVEKNPNFISYVKYMVDSINKHKDKLTELYKSKLCRKLDSYYKLQPLLSIVGKIKDANLKYILKYIQLYQDAFMSGDITFDSITILCSICKLKEEKTTQFTKSEQRIKDKYPLLFYIDSSCPLQKIADYICKY